MANSNTIRITHYAATACMGETTTQEAENYRQWAAQQLQAKAADVFGVAPAAVRVSVVDAETAGRTTQVEHQHGYEGEQLADELQVFAAELWDRCDIW